MMTWFETVTLAELRAEELRQDLGRRPLAAHARDTRPAARWWPRLTLRVRLEIVLERAASP